MELQKLIDRLYELQDEGYEEIYWEDDEGFQREPELEQHEEVFDGFETLYPMHIGFKGEKN